MRETGSEISHSIAYPTMGIILLGGLTDSTFRKPRHTSAGITYTGVEEDMFAEVQLFASDRRIGLINGVEVSGSESRSPFVVLDRYRDSILKKEGKIDSQLSFESWSRNIPSGSSDAAAAAFGYCISSILENMVNIVDLENDLRTISESVGRSLKGGLTLTHPGKEPWTELLLPESSFENYEIVAFRFQEPRKPSDRIHENIVGSPEYGKRIEETEQKGRQLAEIAGSEDIEGIFDLAEKDTERYHRLIESVGVNVINPGMLALINNLKSKRGEFWNRYIVTGGSNVFTVIRSEDRAKALALATDSECTTSILRVAGPPVAVYDQVKKDFKG